MKEKLLPLSRWQPDNVKIVFCDIDDTLTNDGLLLEEAFSSLWKLYHVGISVVPVTGRPAGWCEMIARTWPVSAVIGENGGFYFKYDRKQKVMRRKFAVSEEERHSTREKLSLIQEEVLDKVPGTALASDQFCRMIDLAIDFCEDVSPLDKTNVQKIVSIFEKHGAQAKISSIHVNGWFGKHNKLSMCREYILSETKQDPDRENSKFIFIGDSPNDEPMFEFFEDSIGVANVLDFKDQLKTPPKFVTPSENGLGFSEVAVKILGSL